jgi:hypothetical protein
MRVFPILWTHPAVKGITMWGYRPGHWRTAQGAPLAYANGAEKAALVWLRQYVQNTTLPISLISFDAKRNGDKVALNWRTALEINNDRFVIERSRDGRTFIPILTLRANANGAGAYTAVDDRPAEGINFYKLIQYDKDGRRTEQGVRAVNMGDKDFYVQVYPNPASGYFIIRTQPDAFNKGVITITDQFGRTLKTVALAASGVQTMQTADLASGTYFIRINSNGISVINKVIISK